jgi:galactokinase
MDQLISATAQANSAGLIDCRTLQVNQIALPANAAILIVHSGVERGLVDSEYNTRRKQCEQVAQHFGVPALRDVTASMLQAAVQLDSTAVARARHVITENDRTVAAAQALRDGDLSAFGQLMAASHHSMRDDFEITTPKIDSLVWTLQTAIGDHGGARMTGGGFGGCVVAVMDQDALPAAIATVNEYYRTPQGARARQFVCSASAGASVSYVGSYVSDYTGQ